MPFAATNESIYETESQTQRTDWRLPSGRGLPKGRAWSGRLGLANVSFYT